MKNRYTTPSTAVRTWMPDMNLLHLLFAAVAAFGLLAPPSALGQGKGGGFGGGFEGGLEGGFGQQFGFPGAGGANFEVSAKFEVEKGSDRGRVLITGIIGEGWHLYSTTQQSGGPLPTEISVTSDFAEATGPFAADQEPDINESDIWPGLPIEEHHGTVVWTAPIKLKTDVDPESNPVAISINGQVCMTDGACVPVNEKISASFVGYYGGEETTTELRAENTHAVWTASLEPQQVKPGGSVTLKITAATDEGYHVYPFVAGSEETDFRTLIVATSKAGLRFGAPVTAAEVESVDIGLDEPVKYYKGDVEWVIPVTIPEKAGEGEHPIAIEVAFMTCNDRSCDPPAAVRLTGIVNVSADATGGEKLAMSIAGMAYKDVLGRDDLGTWIDTEEKQGKASAPKATLLERSSGDGLELWMVFAALTGGFILNFMPCVLPVIGLKLMSFVNQSGNSHSRVVALNFSYVGGIVAVMLVLALANVSAKLAGDAFGWGQQFTRIEFQVPMAVLIFAMALSFLGVWEIPIPGFATSSKSGELMEKEGLSGAFFKGVLTTILATPCSGPFLGTLFGLTLTLSVFSILQLYILVGIGLGLPYLALCVYPGFIKMMPKPGAWMETLKQILAFPLLMTVVYFISMIAPDYRVATLILLIVVWFACWLIGRVPAYAEKRRLAAAWVSGVATTILGAVVGFAFFGPVNHELDWTPYNEAVLAQHRNEGKTVMVEFTARWCLTCQSNMKFAIDRPDVAALVEENEVVPMLADWSEPNPQILRKIQELNSLSIPLLAIYPPGPNSEPIILRDAITESQLLEALEQAGPSLGEAAVSSEAPPGVQLTSTPAE